MTMMAHCVQQADRRARMIVTAAVASALTQIPTADVAVLSW